MKIICLIMLTVLLITPVQAKKVASLQEIMKPDMFAVGDERIVISEKTTIYIYSLKDFRLIKKFGKEGEGPREFKNSPFGPPMITLPYKGKIYVSSNSKVSVFTNQGEFIREARIMPFQVYRPFGDKFLFTATGTDENKQNVLSVNLANDKFEKQKELYLSDLSIGPAMKFIYPGTSFSFAPYKDKIYIVAGKEGFVIDVFDGNGTKLYRVKKEYEQLTVPDEYKKKTKQWFQTNPDSKQFWEFFKDRISFRTHYPAILDMFVTDDRIYVLTYKQKDGKTELIIMDLKGKEEKRVFVPMEHLYGNDYYSKHDIYKGNWYTLIENVDEETWELHKMKLID